MERVFRLISDGAADLARHPLFTWLRAAPVPLGNRLAVLPALAPFAMGYKDVCTWALTYDNPQGALQQAINAHAAEDATHSALYVENWRALGLDEATGWGTADILWWMFAAAETDSARRAGTDLMAMPAADGGDPLLRAAWAEAVEAAGAVFFGVIAPLAEQYRAQTGTDSRYLGSYHLAREGGHVGEHDLFTRCTLTPDRLKLAAGLADQVLGLFRDLFDSLLRYGVTYAGPGRFPSRFPGRPAADALGPAGLPCPGRAGAAAPSPLIQSALDEHTRRGAGHPLYRWLGSPEGGTAEARLSVLVPDWAVGIMGYPEVLRLLAGPRDDAAVRAWTASLAWHGAAFLTDWDELELDSHPARTASGALEWLYLEPHTDVHRRNMATFTQLAAGCRTPMERSWLLEILEASGDPWFAVTSALAAEAETDPGPRLNYLAGRLETPPPGGGAFLRGPLTAAEEHRIAAMVAPVFGAVDRQLDSTWLRIRPRQWAQRAEGPPGERPGTGPRGPRPARRPRDRGQAGEPDLPRHITADRRGTGPVHAPGEDTARRPGKTPPAQRPRVSDLRGRGNGRRLLGPGPRPADLRRPGGLRVRPRRRHPPAGQRQQHQMASRHHRPDRPERAGKRGSAARA